MKKGAVYAEIGEGGKAMVCGFRVRTVATLLLKLQRAIAVSPA